MTNNFFLREVNFLGHLVGDVIIEPAMDFALFVLVFFLFLSAALLLSMRAPHKTSGAHLVMGAHDNSCDRRTSSPASRRP